MPSSRLYSTRMVTLMSHRTVTNVWWLHVVKGVMLWLLCMVTEGDYAMAVMTLMTNVGITKIGPKLSGLIIHHCLMSVTLFQGCCRHINILYLFINECD